jgi:hypothetical protein
VIVEGEDIFGDGVNVAARLEGLAEPGSICVSARVHEDAAGRISAEFADGGKQRLKNIDRPVRVYRLQSPTAEAERAGKAEPDLRHIGFVGVTRRSWYDELRRGLAAYGHVDGQTIRIHYRWSEGDLSRFPDLVKELLELPVELSLRREPRRWRRRSR